MGMWLSAGCQAAPQGRDVEDKVSQLTSASTPAALQIPGGAYCVSAGAFGRLGKCWAVPHQYPGTAACQSGGSRHQLLTLLPPGARMLQCSAWGQAIINANVYAYPTYNSGFVAVPLSKILNSTM